MAGSRCDWGSLLAIRVIHLKQTDYTGDGYPVIHSREYYVQDAFEITVVRGAPSLY